MADPVSFPWETAPPDQGAPTAAAPTQTAAFPWNTPPPNVQADHPTGSDGVPTYLRRPASEPDTGFAPPQPVTAPAKGEPFRYFGDLPPALDDQDVIPGATEPDKDIAKGIVGAPLQGLQGVNDTAESVLNLGLGASNALYNLPGSLANKFLGAHIAPAAPVKVTLPKDQLIEPGGALHSTTGDLERAAVPFLLTRGGIGAAAKAEGAVPELTKDAAAMYAAYPGDQGHLSDLAVQSDSPWLNNPITQAMATQPGDSDTVGRLKNVIENEVPGRIAGAVIDRLVGAFRGEHVPAEVDAPDATSGPAQPPPSGAAAAPSAPTAPPVGAQPGQPSTGQVAPTLNATPAAGLSPAASQQASDTAKILGRLLRSSGVSRDDVNNLVPALVQRFQSTNDPRVALARFVEGDLAQQLPQQTVDEVKQKLRGFGSERYRASEAGDTSRATMKETVGSLRGSQEDYLTGALEDNLYKRPLIGQEDKISAEMANNAKIGYGTALDHGRQRLASGLATPEETRAAGDLSGLIQNPAFAGEIPKHMKVKAQREGVDLSALVQRDPIEAAHWMQSELRQASDAAEGVGGTPTSESRLYGEMRTSILDLLEKAVPGYQGARLEHGDLYGAKEAIDFGKSFFASARDQTETARMARRFKQLSKRQQTTATMSIRDSILNEFRTTGEDAAAKVTRLQQAGVLDALPKILGAKGERVAGAIRNVVHENEWLRDIDPLHGKSPTADNLAIARNAADSVRSPFNKTVGAFSKDKDNFLPQFATALGLDALGGHGLATGGLLASKVGSSIISNFGKPSKRMLSSATKGLFELPKPAALAPTLRIGAGAPRGARSPLVAPQVQATLDDLLRKYDTIDHRADPKGAQRLLSQIGRLKKQLASGPAATSSAPILASTPGKTPPNKAGFNIGPGVIGASFGGTAAANSDPNDTPGNKLLKGLVGSAAGYLGGRAFSHAPGVVKFFGEDAAWDRSVVKAAKLKAGGASPEQLAKALNIGPEFSSEAEHILTTAAKNNPEAAKVLGITPHADTSKAAQSARIGERLDRISSVAPMVDRANALRRQALDLEDSAHTINERGDNPHEVARRLAQAEDLHQQADDLTAKVREGMKRSPVAGGGASPDGETAKYVAQMRESGFPEAEIGRRLGIDPARTLDHDPAQYLRDKEAGNITYNGIFGFGGGKKPPSGGLGKEGGEGGPAISRSGQASQSPAQIEWGVKQPPATGANENAAVPAGERAQLGFTHNAPAEAWDALPWKGKEHDPWVVRWSTLQNIQDELTRTGGKASGPLEQLSQKTFGKPWSEIAPQFRELQRSGQLEGNVPAVESQPRENPNDPTNSWSPPRPMRDDGFWPNGWSDSDILQAMADPSQKDAANAMIERAKRGDERAQRLARYYLSDLPPSRSADVIPFNRPGDLGRGSPTAPAETKPKSPELPKPPVKNGLPFGGGKSQPARTLSPKIIAALAKAKVPEEVKLKLAANAKLPEAARQSANEATAYEPSLYKAFSGFQGRKNSPLDSGVRDTLQKLGSGRTPNVDPIADLAARAEQQRRAAVSAASRWNTKTNTQAAEAAGIPEKPVPKSLANQEDRTTQLAIAAKRVLQEGRLGLDSSQDAMDWATTRRNEIVDALYQGPPRAEMGSSVGTTGRAFVPSGEVMDRPKGAPPIFAQTSQKRGDPVKRPSRQEAEDAGNLMFNAEYAQLLHKALTDPDSVVPRSPEHMALRLAAVGGTVGAIALGWAEMGKDLEKKGDEARAANGLPPRVKPIVVPRDPRVLDWEKTKTNHGDVVTLQANLNALGYRLFEDGGYVRRDGKKTATAEAFEHWQASHGFDPAKPATNEQLGQLTAEADAARKTGKSDNGPARGALSRQSSGLRILSSMQAQ